MKDSARIYRKGNRWKADYLNKTYTFLEDMPLHEVEKTFSDKGVGAIRETDLDED